MVTESITTTHVYKVFSAHPLIVWALLSMEVAIDSQGGLA